MEPTKHYFYVLECNDHTFYAGYTTNLIRREKEHNSDTKGAKYTRVRRPVKVIYFEAFGSRSDATKAEATFKKLTRKQKEAYIKHATTKKLSKQ